AADRRRGHAGRDLAPERLHGPVGGGDGNRPEQPGADRRGDDRRRLGHDPHEPDGGRDEPLDPRDRRGRLRRGRRGRGRRGRGRARGHGEIHERGRRGDPAGLREPRGDRPRLRDGGRAGAARGARADQGARAARRRGQLRDPPGRGADAGAHERAARRGRRALRPAEGDGRREPRVPAHRRLAGDRRERRDEPRGEEHALLADLRDADPRSEREPFGDRDQALDEPRLRGNRKRALLRARDLDAVRRREVGGLRDHRRARAALIPPVAGARRDRSTRLCETARVIERSQALAALSEEEFDVAVVGGGITGAGVALDAASRGYSVALLERADFAAGTSSRSSKLVHGGLRYLQNFDLGLVREALLERQLMVHLAPHLVKPLPLIVPAFDGAKPDRLVGVGLNLYDVMAVERGRLRGRRARRKEEARNAAERGELGEAPEGTEPDESWSPERHRVISGEEVVELLPALAAREPTSGYLFYDCQTDDARLVLTVLGEAERFGAVCANRLDVTGLLEDGGHVEP